MNVSLPPLHCLLRREFMYDGQEHHGEFEEVYVFGATSLQNWAVTFTVMTTRGAQFTRIPVHALVHKEAYKEYPLHFLELWNCFSYQMHVVRYDFLKNSRCRVILSDGS